MELSTLEQIQNYVQYDNNDFSFIDTYGKMIINKQYAKGYEQFSKNKNTEDAFIYTMLSVIGSDIENTLYLNIKKYIDFVSNVDICKVKSLKSMLYIFGFNYSIFNNIDSIPLDVYNLINIFSINRNYLLKSGILDKKLIEILKNEDNNVIYNFDDKINFRKYFAKNSYQISTDQNCINSKITNIIKLNNIFQQTSSFISSDIDGNIISNYIIYQNDYKYSIIDDKIENTFIIRNDKQQKIFQVNEVDVNANLTSLNDFFNISISDLNDFYDGNDNEFINNNIEKKLNLIYKSIEFNEKIECINDENYENYLINIFYNLLYRKLTIKYNAKFYYNNRENEIYVYPYLSTLYYDEDIQIKNTKFNSLQELDENNQEVDQILQLKLYNHIPKSFNEQKIVDNIEDGIDFIDNYSGAELSILNIEIENRKNTLDLNKIGVSNNSSKLQQTRYSYYREKEVADYANFIDNYFNFVNLDSIEYDFDPNYYNISKESDQISTVIKQDIIAQNANPDNDLNTEMIYKVSQYLASLTIYISKIREKIKLQTQKNYMKGTNLLLIYIINEYLNEYSRHNKDFFLEDDIPELKLIYNKLSNHQFSDEYGNYSINVNEYYDNTEYFNIETNTSISSIDYSSTNINSRYWESTLLNNEYLMNNDGKTFILSEIERFYLSTLNLNTKLNLNNNRNNGLQNFLSSLYDLGANNSFYYSPNDQISSLFASVLSDGSFSSDIYERFINLSISFDKFNSYIDDTYLYPKDNIKNQINDVIYNHISVNLSNEYLADVSVFYDKYKPTIDLISDDIINLSTEYIEFINGTYSFYYIKSQNKYCYENQDVYTGEYLPGNDKYFVDNELWLNDTMYFYQNLTSLQKYSTEPYIKNWGLMYSITYISSNVLELSNSITLINQQLTEKYKFIDPYSITLDNELEYTYNFLTNLITEKKEVLTNQLKSLQEQANNLKTQYENLDNTFNNALASYNDNYEGYSLGDKYIYCVTWNKLDDDLKTKYSKTCSMRYKDGKPASKNTYVFCINPHEIKEANNYEYVWYWSKNADSSNQDYGYEQLEIDPVYNADSSLTEKCEAVKAYIGMPTSKNWVKNSSGTYEANIYYGLANDGIKATVDNVTQGLNNIQQSFDNICEQAKELFNLDTNFSAVDLYEKILELISKLNSIDESIIQENDQLAEYNKYIKEVLELSSKYQPILASFKNIFQDPEQSNYLKDFSYQMSELTFDNLNILQNFYIKKDQENLTSIQVIINNIVSEKFNSIYDKKTTLEVDMQNDGLKVQIDVSNNIEECLDKLNNILISDLLDRIYYANLKIQENLELIYSYLNVISTEISAKLDSYEEFNDCTKQKINELNFFQQDIYQNYNKLFLTYGGKDFCYDPYYNMKNTIHPSYQVHPFLWNAVEKTKTMTLIESGFKSQLLDEITYDGFIGKFGQTIDTWKNANKGLIDYSGYLSRYEKSTNISQSGAQSEVVDYDGAFYPPAIDWFNLNTNACIKSVKEIKVKKDITKNSFNQILSNDISTYFAFDTLGKIISSDIYNNISSLVNSYFVSNDIQINLNTFINEKNKEDIITITKLEVINSIIIPSLPQTFYERFYQHLGLPDTQLNVISEQLIEYQDLIKEITSPQNINQVYDIYKYGLDQHKNSYILYKKYDYSKYLNTKDLTYHDKRNTLGEIWIRLADNPIAFPAFYGKNPAYYIQDPNSLNNAILKLAELEKNGIIYTDKYKLKIDSINNRMRYFYDFEITQDKSNIAYISYNWKLNYNNIFYKRFDFSIIIPGKVQTEYDKYKDLEYLLFKNSSNNTGNNIDYIDFDPKDGYIHSYRNIHQLNEDNLINGIRYPSLVGYYVHDNTYIDFIYMYKRYQLIIDEDKNIIYDIRLANIDKDDEEQNILPAYDNQKTFFIVKIGDGNQCIVSPSQNGVKISQLEATHKKTIGDNICVGYDKNRNYFTLAFLTQLDDTLSNIIQTETSISSINFDKNTDGAIVTDPTETEMNSHDIINQNIMLLEYQRKDSSPKFKNLREYNINADISYLPSYPTISGEFELYKKYNSNYYNIELLGKSHNIDNYIKLVNPNPDPYFDINKIEETTEFGRVYEDYVKEYEKTFVQLTNPSLNSNMPLPETYSDSSPFICYDNGQQYVLQYRLQKINLSAIYNQHDINSMQVIIYNNNCLGKNPYYIGKLINLTSEIELNYNNEVIDNQLEQKVYTKNGDFSLIGTSFVFDQAYHQKDSNHINGIESIKAIFNNENYNLILKFKYENDEYDHEYIYVPENEIQILLYNTKDLTIFKYYHMLDSYGVVNCRYLALNYDRFEDEIHDGWGIYYDENNIDPNDISTLMMSYYYDESHRKQFLKDLELSSYDYLSDVYILYGNKRLSFKYDEELQFDLSNDLYYYPTLNLSYPRTKASYIELNQPFNINSAEALKLNGIFKQESLFIIDIDDPITIINNIGTVSIPIIFNDVDDIRAYEDYLSVDENELENYKKYDSGDPRIFEYIHFSVLSSKTTDGIHKNITEPININENYYRNKSVQEFLQTCEDELSGCHCMTSEELTSDITFEYIDFTPNSDICDISKLLKIYVGYKKDENNEIHLYFNYMNYINSPFIKIENGTEIKLDTIEQTYLKLKPSEDGFLDIIIQFKYYIGDTIYGYLNAKVLSYHIYNISDDKPKFLISKCYEIEKNSLCKSNIKNEVKIKISPVEIDLDSIQYSNRNKVIDVPVYVNMEMTSQLTSEISFYLNYPSNLLTIDTSETSVHEGYSIDENESANGMLKVMITNNIQQKYVFNFKIRFNYSQLINYNNKKYLLSIDKNPIFDNYDKECLVTVENSYLQIVKLTKNILADHDEDLTNIDVVIVNSFNNGILID